MSRYNGNTMSKRQWLILIGAWVMVFLFIGLPSSWENVLAVVTGLLICFVAYQFGPGVSVVDSADNSKPYVEHRSVATKASEEIKTSAASDNFENKEITSNDSPKV